jgi:parallel beta-helix repeat protein
MVNWNHLSENSLFLEGAVKLFPMKAGLLLFLFCSSPSLAGNTYFVSSQGSDQADGSQDAPWLTLDKAMATVPAGSTVVLRAGRYNGPVIVRVPNVTIQGHKGEKAAIQTSVDSEKNGNNLWFMAAGGTVRDLELEGGYHYALKFEQGGALVENCKVHGSGHHGIKIPSISGGKVTIRKCEIYNTGRRDKAGQGIDNVRSNDLLVQECHIHDVPAYGASAKGGSRDCVFERNLFVNCGAGIFLGGTTDDDLFDTTVNPQKWESIDCTARNNIILSSKYAGIGMWKAQRPHVYNNTIYHPCLADNQGGILVQFGSEEPTIINNVVVMAQKTNRPLVYLKHPFTGRLTMDHNCYWREGGRAIWWDNSAGFKALSSLSDWQARRGVDKHSLFADPRVDSKTGFLLSESPCIEKGQTISSFHCDFRGQPRPAGATWTIGADEWVKEKP